ncbi:MAG TPA: hypothetical protein EYP85_00380, partial [Armatimonadetes bacterium]|nr:hypothetical protein [Armatimonadota bacterium]
MQASVVLTVAESKRLIAQGVAAWPSVQRALQEGLVIIATGTTNAYVVEEILGKSINKAAYVTGRTIPATVDATGRFPKPMPDVILQRGEVVEGLDRFTAVKQLQPGDVFIKGANALNYERKIAGIAVGHPEGGTVGAAYGPLIARRATWV